MLTRSWQGKSPQIASDCFVAENAVLIGDVTLDEGSSVWYQCTLRGDIAAIRVGKRCNIQDNCVFHGIVDGPVILGDDVAVGHGAILHAVTVEDCCLIGMGAVVLDSAVIGRGSIVGAGSVVPPRTVIPPHSLVMGVPAKVVRQLPEDSEEARREHCRLYGELAAAYRDGVE